MITSNPFEINCFTLVDAVSTAFPFASTVNEFISMGFGSDHTILLHNLCLCNIFLILIIVCISLISNRKLGKQLDYP